jgi:hypothetical protein
MWNGLWSFDEGIDGFLRIDQGNRGMLPHCLVDAADKTPDTPPEFAIFGLEDQYFPLVLHY